MEETVDCASCVERNRDATSLDEVDVDLAFISFAVDDHAEFASGFDPVGPEPSR